MRNNTDVHPPAPSRPLRAWHIAASGFTGFILGVATIIGVSFAFPIDEDAEAGAKTDTRERLEAQGIVYSADDWETTVSKICRSKYPDIYMGIDGSIETHKADMTKDEQINAIFEFATAPNVNDMDRRERQAVLDMVLDNECGQQ